ncbi:preprotein translocase subunit SecE [bacterium]|nr:preprotein translocase subunit SecE [candidate division CSSED10-310 bacterium]
MATSTPKKGNGSKPTQRKKPGWLVFLDEVNVEMKKVTWPSRKEIIGSTGALIVATLMIGVFLGLVDFVLAKGVQPAMAGYADAWSYITLVIFASILVWVYKSN